VIDITIEIKPRKKFNHISSTKNTTYYDIYKTYYISKWPTLTISF